VWARDETSAGPTVARAASGLLSWRDWIVELADLFARAPDGAAAVALERHALATLAAVVERTGAGDAWYKHAHQVLTWLLESRGEGRDAAGAIVGRAIGGRFESWAEPDDDLGRDVARAIRDGALARGPFAGPDGLEAWWSARAATDWGGAFGPGRAGGGDATLEHVVRHDAAVDEARGDRMLSALGLARADARAGAELTWERLVAWQAVVTGRPADVRTGDAWARDGRERYGRPPDLEGRVRRALADASAAAPSAVARAARVYLDVCFLHPFRDGNARAARLALDFVLTRAGLGLEDAEGLIFRLPLPASDPAVGARYLALLARHVVRRP
jgi:hypothetical protein